MSVRVCEPCGSLYLPGPSPHRACPHCCAPLRGLTGDEAYTLACYLLADQDPPSILAPGGRKPSLVLEQSIAALREHGNELRRQGSALRDRSYELRDQSRRLCGQAPKPAPDSPNPE